MFEDSYLAPIRTVTCLVHKKEKATHFCTQLQCMTNPMMCAACFNDTKFRSAHLGHEQALKPLPEAVETLAELIKRQLKPMQSAYERTLGLRENEMVKSNLQKIDYLTEQIQNRMGSIKMQLQLQIELLTKEFQRQMLLEKQEFMRRIDDYKRTFFNNLEILKKESAEIVSWEAGLKFYSNPSTLLLKISTEAQKRSLDWILQQKRTLARIVAKNESQYSQSNPYSTLSTYINKVNEMNMMIKPIWVGQKKELQNEKELKSWIKSNLQSWVALPELKDLSRSVSQQGQTGSHHSSTHEYRSSYSPIGTIYGQTSSNPYSNNMI